MTAESLCRAINETAEIAAEWSSVLGDPPEGSVEREMQRVLNDIDTRLSHISFAIGFRGIRGEEGADM
jgi:hypothetical protein